MRLNILASYSRSASQQNKRFCVYELGCGLFYIAKMGAARNIRGEMSEKKLKSLQTPLGT